MCVCVCVCILQTHKQPRCLFVCFSTSVPLSEHIPFWFDQFKLIIVVVVVAVVGCGGGGGGQHDGGVGGHFCGQTVCFCGPL